MPENRARKKIVGMLLTHGHEDHIGGLPFILPQLPFFPLYGSPLTAALANEKLREFNIQPIQKEQPKQPATPTFLLELPLIVDAGQTARLRAHLEAARQLYNAILSEGQKRLPRRDQKTLELVDCFDFSTMSGLINPFLELEYFPFDGFPRKGIPFIHRQSKIAIDSRPCSGQNHCENREIFPDRAEKLPVFLVLASYQY